MDVGKYAELFLTESREHLGTCNQLLLEWERDPAGAAGHVAGLFRSIHTLKGMAGTMGYGKLADLAHRAENLLDSLRAGKLVPGPDLLELLFRAVDALEDGVEEAAQGRDAQLELGRIGSELDRDLRDARTRCRADAHDVRQTGERVLDRNRDTRLELLGAHRGVLGDDVEDRRG